MSTPAERMTPIRLAGIRASLTEGVVWDIHTTPADVWDFATELLSEHDAVLADNERLTAEVDGARAVQAELDTELATAKRRLETSYQRFDQLADQLHQVVRELAEAKADLQRAEAEVSRWVKADSADIAAGSYAGEVERLTGELADTRAKLAAASRAVAATDGRDRATYWRGWDDCVTAVKGQLGRRPEPAQPPAVAAPDAQDRARRAQEDRGGDSGARVDAGSGQGATEAQGAARASEFAVYSHEHEAWWKPGRRSYTHTFGEAGRYSGDEAHQICYDASYRWRRSGKDIHPPEVMIPIDSELITMGARDQEIELLGRIHVATQRTVNARREGRNYTTWICLDQRHEDCPGTDSAGNEPCGCKCHGESSDG